MPFTSSTLVVSVTLMAATVLLVLVLVSSHLASKLKLTLLVLVQLADSKSQLLLTHKGHMMPVCTGRAQHSGGDAWITTVGMGYSDNTTYIIRTVTNYDSETGRATLGWLLLRVHLLHPWMIKSS